MGKRKVIVIPFLTNYSLATGVVIYLINLVKNFNALADEQKPKLIILYGSVSPIEDIRQIGYPFIRYCQLDKPVPFIIRAINKAWRMIFNTPLIRKEYHADFIYPAYEDPAFVKIKHKIFWKEDFQESYFPSYFSEKEFAFVQRFFETLKTNPDYQLVLSSQSAGQDLRTFYLAVTNRVHYLRFVSLLPRLHYALVASLQLAHTLPAHYFIVCNQFWPHKNHITVIKAVEHIVSKGYTDFAVVFTGKTTTTRNPHYFGELKSYMATHGLTSFFRITGFIEREQQLLLMKNSAAVIQPSLFEGWSTVIEDAKALNKFVLAADLDVNKEQLDRNACFFERTNEHQLAELMIQSLTAGHQVVPLDYADNIRVFRKELIQLFDLDANR